MKRWLKRIFFTAALVLLLALVGVTVYAVGIGPAPAIRASLVRETVLETDTLALERDGLRLRVLDLEGGQTFTIKPVRVRKVGKSSAGLQPVRCLVQTETILIETGPGVVIVTQRHTGRRYAVPFP